MLQTPRPRPTGLAFLGGWVLGLVALTAVFVASSDALSGLHNKPPAWASWTRVVLGLALIAFGIYRWLTREGHTESPKWMRSFETLTPARALATGLVLVVVRVEVLTMCALAGLAIGSGSLGNAGELDHRCHLRRHRRIHGRDPRPRLRGRRSPPGRSDGAAQGVDGAKQRRDARGDPGPDRRLVLYNGVDALL